MCAGSTGHPLSRQDMLNPDYNYPKEMAWSAPQYARHEINHAGDCLIADEKVVWVVNRDQMLAIINN